MVSIDGFENNQIYKVVLVKLDNVDITDKVNNNLVIENIDNETYNLRFKINVYLNFSKECLLEMRTETITPITDIHFHQAVIKPCKRYSITFMLYEDGYNLSGYGFGLMRNSSFSKTILAKGMTLRFTDWILPGDGVIFSVTKKSKKE